MVAKHTPSLYATGKYEVLAPWSLKPNAIYRCIAIRSFEDIYKLGKDVYSSIYEPMGLIDKSIDASSTFDFDVEASYQPNIITLQDTNGAVIYVPDTYIKSYPLSSDITYEHIVLSVSLGALPSNLDVTEVKNAVKDTVTRWAGVDATVLEHRAISTEQPSFEEAQAAEVARVNNIRETKTPTEKLIEKEATIARQQDVIDQLTTLCRENGLL